MLCPHINFLGLYNYLLALALVLYHCHISINSGMKATASQQIHNSLSVPSGTHHWVDMMICFHKARKISL